MTHEEIRAWLEAHRWIVSLFGEVQDVPIDEREYNRRLDEMDDAEDNYTILNVEDGNDDWVVEENHIADGYALSQFIINATRMLDYLLENPS